MSTWEKGFADRVLEKLSIDVRSITTDKEDLLPTTHLSNPKPKEKKAAKGLRQAAKDVPMAALAGGLGYGIGRTLVEVIGERVAATGAKPGWVKAVPYGVAALSAAGAYAAGKARDSMRQRQEA